MQLVMVLSVVLSMVVGTHVGLRLIRLARKTRKGPELAVGISLVSYAAVSQLGLLAFEALGAEAGVAVRMTLATVRVLAYVVTLIALAVFTWQVFGATSAWRRTLVAGIVCSALVGASWFLQAVWVQVNGGATIPLMPRSVLNVCFAVLYAWMGAEALRYHGLMRRRRALGLADAVVTNRFFLWGAGAVASSLLVMLMFVFTLLGMGLTSGNPIAGLLVTAIGLLNTAVWALTFTPPEFYRRWVRAHASRLDPLEPAHG